LAALRLIKLRRWSHQSRMHISRMLFNRMVNRFTSLVLRK
jgi:hypothetical protein